MVAMVSSCVIAVTVVYTSEDIIYIAAGFLLVFISFLCSMHMNLVSNLDMWLLRPEMNGAEADMAPSALPAKGAVDNLRSVARVELVTSRSSDLPVTAPRISSSATSRVPVPTDQAT